MAAVERATVVSGPCHRARDLLHFCFDQIQLFWVQSALCWISLPVGAFLACWTSVLEERSAYDQRGLRKGN